MPIPIENYPFFGEFITVISVDQTDFRYKMVNFGRNFVNLELKTFIRDGKT